MTNPTVIPVPPERPRPSRMADDPLTPGNTNSAQVRPESLAPRLGDDPLGVPARTESFRSLCGQLADLDLKAGFISIRRLKGSLHTVQPLYQHRGQPLLDETTALRAYLRKRVADGSDFLFTSQQGGLLDRSQFFRRFQMIAEAAGLPLEKRHPHVLKHSLASHLIAGNVNLASVRQALGHRSISSTMAYIGTTDVQAGEAARAALMGLF